MDESKPKRRGRPPIGTQEVKDKVVKLFGQPYKETEVARIIGVTRQSLWNWKGQDPAFLYAINESKVIADKMVEGALAQNALGYNLVTKKVLMTKNNEPVEYEQIDHFRPSYQAQMFWLKNRQSKKWRDRVEVQMDMQEAEEMTGPDGTVITDER